MTDKKKRDLKHTPKGIVSGFTAIQKPATNFVKTGMFETQLAFEAEAIADLVETLEEIRDKKFLQIQKDNPKVKKVLSKADVTTPEMDDEGDETGRVILKFRQKALIELENGDSFKKTIMLVDARGKRITKKVKIGAGSVGKASFEAIPYYNAKDKVVGVTLRFVGFQLIKLVEFEGGGGPSNEEMGFGDESDDEDAFDSDAYSADEDDDQDDDEPSDDDDDEEDF